MLQGCGTARSRGRLAKVPDCINLVATCSRELIIIRVPDGLSSGSRARFELTSEDTDDDRQRERRVGNSDDALLNANTEVIPQLFLLVSSTILARFCSLDLPCCARSACSKPKSTHSLKPTPLSLSLSLTKKKTVTAHQQRA